MKVETRVEGMYTVMDVVSEFDHEETLLKLISRLNNGGVYMFSEGGKAGMRFNFYENESKVMHGASNMGIVETKN